MAQRVVCDIPYKTGASLSEYERQRCLLDVHLPESGRHWPTVIWFHGGGLEDGSKSPTPEVATALVRQGLACVVPNYRLSPRAEFPAYVDDAAAAVAWTVNHITEHGGDPRRIVVGGHSAGAYLAAMVGFDQTYLAPYGVQSSTIAGLILMSGQVFTHSRVRKERGMADSQTRPVIDHAAPAYHARVDAPPVLMLVAGNDMPMRLEEKKYLLALLRHLNHPDASLQIIPGRDHGGIGFVTREDDPALMAMLAFINRLGPRK